MPKLVEINCTWTQPAPSCGDDREERIEISAIRGQGGHYLAIYTDSWSFDSPQDLKNLLNTVTEIVAAEKARGGE